MSETAYALYIEDFSGIGTKDLPARAVTAEDPNTDYPQISAEIKGPVPRKGDKIFLTHMGSKQYPYYVDGAILRVVEVCWGVNTDADLPWDSRTNVEVTCKYIDGSPGECGKCKKNRMVTHDIKTGKEFENDLCLACRKEERGVNTDFKQGRSNTNDTQRNKGFEDCSQVKGE